LCDLVLKVISINCFSISIDSFCDWTALQDYSIDCFSIWINWFCFVLWDLFNWLF